MTEAGQSLKSRLRIAVVTAGVLAVVAVVAGIVAFLGLLEARARLVDEVDPASLAAEQLLSAMVDQETGVRAYVISSNELFLEPFEQGRIAQERAQAELRRLADQLGPLRDPLATANSAIARWHDEYATATRDAVDSGEPGPAEDPELARGRALFDDVREAIGTIEVHLADERADAKAGLGRATAWLLGSLLAVVAVLLATIVGFTILLRRQVGRPLDHLRDETRLVAGGDFAHRVVPVGLSEFQDLGADVEVMRQRIVVELEALAGAREELERVVRDLERSNGELEQFAYVASHDLQEPLRKVSAFCQLLQSRYGGQLDERADQYIEFAVDGAKRMQVLITDLLAFSRVGRDRSPIEVVPAGELVGGALANLAAAIEEHDAVVSVAPDLPLVSLPRSQGVAVFQNLIGNALKFRRPGVVPRVDVTVRPVEGGNEFTVHDNGIGMDAAYAERVFVIFQRLHTKEAYPGTGIGLALCRKIVESNGGSIWVDTAVTSTGQPAVTSTVDDGTPVDDADPSDPGATIRFRLPVAVTALAARPADAAPGEPVHPAPEEPSDV